MAYPDYGSIIIRGARENNLKNVSLDIPKRRITVFTGVSGSGKSSLVFSTIAAESQRLINETYPAFVQQFMPHYGQPDADLLENISAAIIVDQQRLGGNPALDRGDGDRHGADAARAVFQAGRAASARAGLLFLQRSARHVPGLRRRRPGGGDGYGRGGGREQVAQRGGAALQGF